MKALRLVGGGLLADRRCADYRPPTGRAIRTSAASRRRSSRYRLMSSSSQSHADGVTVTSSAVCAVELRIATHTDRSPEASASAGREHADDGVAINTQSWAAHASSGATIRRGRASSAHVKARDPSHWRGIEYSGAHRKAPCGGRVPAPSPRSRCICLRHRRASMAPPAAQPQVGRPPAGEHPSGRARGRPGRAQRTRPWRIAVTTACTRSSAFSFA